MGVGGLVEISTGVPVVPAMVKPEPLKLKRHQGCRWPGGVSAGMPVALRPAELQRAAIGRAHGGVDGVGGARSRGEFTRALMFGRRVGEGLNRMRSPAAPAPVRLNVRPSMFCRLGSVEAGEACGLAVGQAHHLARIGSGKAHLVVRCGEARQVGIADIVARRRRCWCSPWRWRAR